MIKYSVIFLFFICGIIICGCSKPYQQALPTVEFVSAVPYGLEDSVLLTGKVTSSGAGAVEYTGFSFSNTPSFDLLTNQILLNGTSGQFTAIIPATHDSTYYFKSFAANNYGYCVSGVYKYTVPGTKPDSAPCTLSSNSFILGGNSYSFSYVSTNTYPGLGSYSVEAEFSGGYYYYDVYFNMVPVNGQYSVLNSVDFSSSSNKYAVTIELNGSYPFDEGGYLYIAQNKDGTTTLSFCSLNVDLFSQNYSVSSKVTF